MIRLVEEVYTKGLTTYYGDEEDLQPASSIENNQIKSLIRLSFPTVS